MIICCNVLLSLMGTIEAVFPFSFSTVVLLLLWRPNPSFPGVLWANGANLDAPPCCCWERAHNKALGCSSGVSDVQSTMPRVQQVSCYEAVWCVAPDGFPDTPHFLFFVPAEDGVWRLVATSDSLFFFPPPLPPLLGEAHWNQLVSVRRCAHILSPVLLHR